MKRIFILSCLFVVLHSSSAFCSLSVDDYKQMDIEGKEPTWNEITQDQTSFDNWLDYLTEKTNAHYTMPSFSQVADLTANLLAYSVGNYADVASGVLDNLNDTFSLGSDIWDFMTFNVQQMVFDYAPDFVDMLKSGVDEEIYSSSSSAGEKVVGEWYSLPAYYFGGNREGVRESSSNSAPCYACCVRSGSTTYTVMASFVSGQSCDIFTPNISSTFGLVSTYQGSESLGYYTYRSYSNSNITIGTMNGSATQYVSPIGDALSDLFGTSGNFNEPTLNGQGIIVNENPVINPVTLSSALGYPFAQTVINNYNNNTPIPWRPNNYNYVDYNYTYDLPFWEGYELETIAYPEDIEFPSVDFETVEVDTNIDTAIEGLSGWIIEFLLIAILLLVLGLII